MADIKTTADTIRKMRIRDLEGLEVVTTCTLANAMVKIPKGARATVTHATPRWGLTLLFEPCEHCGVSPRIIKVNYRDIKLALDQ